MWAVKPKNARLNSSFNYLPRVCTNLNQLTIIAPVPESAAQHTSKSNLLQYAGVSVIAGPRRRWWRFTCSSCRGDANVSAGIVRSAKNIETIRAQKWSYVMNFCFNKITYGVALSRIILERSNLITLSSYEVAVWETLQANNIVRINWN